MKPVALTIAGSDPSGGAGLQADLKTFQQFGVYGCAAVTLLTVQNTRGVTRVEVMPGELVRSQVLTVIDDIKPSAAKLGALGNREVIDVIAEIAPDFRFPLVIDPVMISKHGAALLDEDARDAFHVLLPLAALIMPNLAEAEALTGHPVHSVSDMKDAAEDLKAMGARAVLVKGGHLRGDAIDILLTDRFHEFESPRIDTPHVHGTGCTYSAAITAGLAKGMDLEESVRTAKRYITEAIRTNPGLGHGNGPVNHFVRV